MLISILLLLSLCSHFPFDLGSILADNQLTGFATTHNAVGNLYTFNLNSATVDGLGRLISADETLTRPSGSTVSHSLSYTYDRRSQLTDASMTNIIGLGTWSGDYNYRNDGNLDDRSVTGEGMLGFAYDYNDDQSDDGNVMTQIGNDDLTWDQNGQLTGRAATTSFNYNWDNKLRSATVGNVITSFKYDPDGARVYKKVAETGQDPVERKYIIDYAADLPVVLAELDPDNYNSVEKTYIYANGQVIAQHDGGYTAAKYFYLHDRLGSVRLLIDDSADVVNHYTYDPFGLLFDTEYTETVANPFRFAGYWWDDQFKNYYCIARYYDPQIQRFTGRDPILGEFAEPLTLHQYVYCLNDPINRWDPDGERSLGETMTAVGLGMNIASMGYNAVSMHKNLRNGDYEAATENLGWLMIDCLSWGMGSKAKYGFQMALAGGQNISIFAQLGLKGAAAGGYVSALGQMMSAMAAADGGVYNLKTSVGRYIGQSKNIPQRILQHLRKGGKFFEKNLIKQVDHLMPDASPLEREIYEQYLIDKYGLKNLVNERNPMGGRMDKYFEMIEDVIEKYNLPR